MGPNRIDTLANPNGPAPKMDPLAEVLNLGGLGEEEDLLKEQLAQAEALRNMPAEHHMSGLAGGLGALARVLNAAAGTYQAGEARRQLGAIQKQRGLGRSAFAEIPGAREILMRALLPAQQPQTAQTPQMLGPVDAHSAHVPPFPWEPG